MRSPHRHITTSPHHSDEASPNRSSTKSERVADIVTVISDYVSLRKAGTTYKGLCPFHGEKTPSFSVNRDRGFFHCFGCGAGGDVFKFVELQEKVDFADAVRQLAQRFGIPIPELESSHEDRESSAERESLLRMHEIAAAYFREQLQSDAASRIREYLTGARKLTPETIETLALGFAPPSRDGLRQRLLKQGFAPGLLVRSGLVTRRDDGTEMDRFRNRLMIPIARDTGSIIAFGGRALEKDQVPKYLNSPETPIYSKSRTLYGLNLTKGDIRKAQRRDHRRGLLRLRAGVSGRRPAGGRDLRHGPDHGAGATAATVHVEGGALLRS